MATYPVLHGNDENARPENLNRPNDEDRERFGFTKRKSKVIRQSSASLPISDKDRASFAAPLAACPEVAKAAVPPLALRSATVPALALRSDASAKLLPGLGGEGAAAPVTLVPLADSTLLDPDATLPLLRTKPAAPKYDFKGRINELTEHNKALRAALIEEREKKKQLADVLVRSEADINLRLRTVEGEANACRMRLETEGNLEKRVQDAVRQVWREQGLCSHENSILSSPRQCEEALPAAAATGGPQLELAELRAQLEALRQCSAAETSRALRAELLLRERDEELVSLREQLQKLHERKEKCNEIVRDAGGLLEQQEKQWGEKFKRLAATSEQREEELTAELAKANARVQELECLHLARQAS